LTDRTPRRAAQTATTGLTILTYQSHITAGCETMLHAP
jgi:hypothetical protein